MIVLKGVMFLIYFLLSSMCNGGLGWFEDLSVADPYYILPMVMCTTTFFQIKMGADGMNVGAMGPIAKKVVYLIPPVMFFFMKDFPAVSATNILGSSSIWTCRISNICFDFFNCLCLYTLCWHESLRPDSIILGARKLY